MGHICYFQQVNKEEYPSIAKTNNFSRKICDNLHVKWSIITSFEEKTFVQAHSKLSSFHEKVGEIQRRILEKVSTKNVNILDIY